MAQVDLFARVPLEPVLTPEQREELESLEFEERKIRAMARVVDEVCPLTASGRRTFDRVKMSDRQYVVAKDGSLRRMRNR